MGLFHNKKNSGVEAKDKKLDHASTQYTVGCKSIPGDSKTVLSETSVNNTQSDEKECNSLAADRSETTVKEWSRERKFLQKTDSSSITSPKTSGYSESLTLKSESSSLKYSRLSTPDSCSNANKCDSNEIDAKQITSHFRYLKDELDADILCDHLIACGLIDKNEEEDIFSVKARNKQVVKMLMILLRKKPLATKQFLVCLDSAGYEHVSKKLGEEKFFPALDMEAMTFDKAMSSLTSCHEEIIDHLPTEVIADVFLEHGEFNMDEYENILSQLTTSTKAEVMFQLLTDPDHLPRRFLVLLNALGDTGNDYLIHILKEENKSLAVGDTIMQRSSSIKLIYPLLPGDERQTRRALKDSSKCEITIKLPSEIKDLELRVVHELNEVNVKIDVNNQLIATTGTIVTEFKNGSIVIKLNGCRPNSFRKLFKRGISGGLVDILQSIFLNPSIRSVLPLEGLEMEVTLTIHPEQHPKAIKTNRDKLKDHTDFLLEEVDALSFNEELKKAGVLTDVEVSFILKTQPVSRRHRTKRMLDMILEKDEADIFADILKEKKNYVWERVFLPETSKQPVQRLSKEYNLFADMISPNAMASDFIVKEALKNETGIHSIRRQADLILQHVLACDVDVQQQFLLALNIYGHIPRRPKSARWTLLGKKEYKTLKAAKTEKLTKTLTVYKGKYGISRRQELRSLPPIRSWNRRTFMNPFKRRRSSKRNNQNQTFLPNKCLQPVIGPTPEIENKRVRQWFQENADSCEKQHTETSNEPEVLSSNFVSETSGKQARLNVNDPSS